MSSSVSITQPGRLQAAWKRFFSPSNRYLSPLLISCVLLVGQLSYGILESYTRTLLAIFASLVAELILSRIYFGKWPNLASAYISGISVGILLRSPAFWPYALCALISITSKYVLRVHDRHIWNPSNFGIVVMFILASGTVAGLSIQWGNFVWPMIVIWILGSAIIWRLRRFHISATYVVSFLGFALLRSWITGDPWRSEIAPITGPMYQLFIFLHDYRSQDHGALEDRPVCGGICRGCGGDGAAPAPGGVRAVLCPLPGGADGHASGNVDGRAPGPPAGRSCLKISYVAGLFFVCCAASLR